MEFMKNLIDTYEEAYEKNPKRTLEVIDDTIEMFRDLKKRLQQEEHIEASNLYGSVNFENIDQNRISSALNGNWRNQTDDLGIIHRVIHRVE